MHYISLGLLLIIIGLVIGVYIHTDRKIDKLSAEIKETDNKLSAEIKETDNKLSAEIKETDNKLSDRMDKLTDRIDRLSDRMDRIYDILVHMGFREKEHRDKAANE